MNVGVFTSWAKAKSFVKTLPKTFEYAIYQLPTNTCLTEGPKLKDVQGFFDHLHFPTDEIERKTADKKGRVISKKK